MTSRILAALLLLATAVSSYAEELVIRAAKVYTVAGAPLAPGAVRVVDGKIVEVAAAIEPAKGATVIDLGKGCLLPGLVDAYTTAGVGGGDSESTLEITPEFRVVDVVDWSSRDFRVAASEGTTTMALVPGTDNVVAGLSCIVKSAGAISANRIVRPEHSLVITLASDPNSRNSARARPDTIFNRQPTNRMGVVWMLRSEFDRSRKSPTKGAALVREALDGKRPVVCLSRLDSDILSTLRLRKEFPIPLTIAGAQEAYKVKPELADARVPLLLAPLTTTTGAGPESTEPVWNLPGELQKANIPFAITCGNLLEQARFAVRYGLNPDAALAAVSATPARLLGLDKRVGTIAVGLDADLVGLSGDPFDLTSAVRWTMVGGRIEYKDQ